MRDPNVIELGKRDARSAPAATIAAQRLALETVVAQGQVGGQVMGLRGSFVCRPQYVPLHKAVDVEARDEELGYTYAVRGAHVVGMKFGTDDQNRPILECYWAQGEYECMRPAGGGE
jgi:hypothetical protein